MTTMSPSTGQELPTGRLIALLVVIAVGTLVYFTGIKPAVREHTLDVRAARRATCSSLPKATESAILDGLGDTDGRVVRAVRAKPSTDGWWMVSANLAGPNVPRGFAGDMATWRVRDDGDLVIESVDRTAEDISTFAPAPEDVTVESEGGFDSRWCSKNAALSP